MRTVIIVFALLFASASAAEAARCTGSWSDHISLHETGTCGTGLHCRTRNPNSSAVGCHQMTRAALADVGWMDRAGNWLPNPYGIGSTEQFTRNAAAQDAVLRAYTSLNWSRIGTGTKSLIGREIAGIRVTEGGLLSAAHFLGPGGLDRFAACGMRPDCISDAAAAANGGRVRAHRTAMTRLAEGSALDVSDITGFHTPGGGGRFTGPGITGPAVPQGAYLPWDAIRSHEVPPHQGERPNLR